MRKVISHLLPKYNYSQSPKTPIPTYQQNYTEDTELIQIVDPNNTPLKSTTRKIMREQSLIHRASYIFIYNQHIKHFYIQKRSINKKYCPGYYDLSFGGVLGYNETYQQNAIREVKEEFGINVEIGIEQGQPQGIETVYKMQELFNFYNGDSINGRENKVFGMSYLVHFNGTEYKKQDSEVEQILQLSLQEIQKMIETEKFTPDALQAFQKLIKEYSQTL